MYSRLMGIQNEFDNYGEPLSNNKIVGKLLRAMMKRPRWEALVSTLEAMQGVNNTLTPDEVFTHLKCFEEKLQQAYEIELRSKNLALPAHNIKHYNPSTSTPNRDTFIQRLDHEVSKNPFLLSDVVNGMFQFERRYNKEREEKNKRSICFMCQKKGHTIHTCYELFSKPRRQESDDEQDHFAFMAFVDESSSHIDIDSIIASKNITDENTLEILRNIAISKGFNAKEEKMEEEASTSTNSENEVYLNSRLFFHGISDSDSESENKSVELPKLVS